MTRTIYAKVLNKRWGVYRSETERTSEGRKIEIARTLRMSESISTNNKLTMTSEAPAVDPSSSGTSHSAFEEERRVLLNG
jgi:hypothetical protein